MQVIVVALAGLVVSTGSAAEPPAGKEPSKKTQEAVQNLKADLTTLTVSVYDYPGNRGGETDRLVLVVDPKKVPAKAKDTFAITEKQAGALVDFLAAEGWFDRVPVPPAGIWAPAWYLTVGGGKPPAGTGGWSYTWGAGTGDKPAADGLIGHLLKSLDGDARKALESLHKTVERPAKK